MVFTVHAMERSIEYDSYHVHTPKLELIEQKISNIESTVQVLFEQSEENRYKYLEINIFGNEEYHKQINGLYFKHSYYNNRVSYLKIYPEYGKTFIAWDPILNEGAGAWQIVHNEERIAYFEDQILINPISSKKRTIFRNNFEKENLYLTALDFAPRSKTGNHYEHGIYKYVIYQFQKSDQKYIMGIAIYTPFDTKFQTIIWVNNGIQPELANFYSGIVKMMLEKFSDPNRNLDRFFDYLPTSMYSGYPSLYTGSPTNGRVYFYPLLDSNLATPPTCVFLESMHLLAEAYREYGTQNYGTQNVESNISRFWSPIKRNYEDDQQNSDDTDMSTNDKTGRSTPHLSSHSNEINLDLQKENEDLLKKNEELQKKNEELQKKNEELQNTVNDFQEEDKISRAKIKESNGEKVLLQKQLADQKKLFIKQLFEEKELSKKSLFQEKNWFEGQLSALQKKFAENKESLEKELIQAKEVSKTQLNDIKEKNKILTQEKTSAFKDNKELNTQIESLSKNKDVLQNEVGVLKKNIEMNKEQKTIFKKKADKAYTEKVEQLQKNFDQALINFKDDYIKKHKESAKSEVKNTPIINVQTEKDTNEVEVQTDWLPKKDPDTPKRDQSDLDNASALIEIDEKFDDCEPEIINLQFFIDLQKDN